MKSPTRLSLFLETCFLKQVQTFVFGKVIYEKYFKGVINWEVRIDA